MEVGGWGEARNRRRDRGRGCSEMAPGRELKAAGGGSGAPAPGCATPGEPLAGTGAPRALLGVCGLRVRGAHCL